MGSRGRTAAAFLSTALAVATLAACGRIAGSPAGPSPSDPPATAAPSLRSDSATVPPEPTPASPGAPSLDLEALRAALLGPSPIPEGWAAEVDDIITRIQAALREHAVPSVAGMDEVEAACTTWQPMVGRLLWANGAFAERHVMLSHLVQLTAVAPAEIAAEAGAAADVVAAAANAQLSEDGTPDQISRTPRDELRAIGRWALAHCELEVVADADPDTEGWTDEDVAASCSLDRRLLEQAQEAYRDGPGEGRYATHPHELEITIDTFVKAGWHRIADVDNDASPPTFTVEPFPGAFCDR